MRTILLSPSPADVCLADCQLVLLAWLHTSRYMGCLVQLEIVCHICHRLGLSRSCTAYFRAEGSLPAGHLQNVASCCLVTESAFERGVMKQVSMGVTADTAIHPSP